MIEPVLLKVAKEKGVDARFNTECLGVRHDEEKVTVTLKDRSSNSTYKVTADYLIAADGANSPIRSQLGIQRTGQGSYGNLLNVLFHTSPSLEPLVKNREFSICKIDRPEVTGIFTSINNTDRWVFHLSYSPNKGEKPEDFPPERCEKLLHKALGIGPEELKIDIKSILPWQASVRVAEKFQVGRIFLAGDSAHQMPPYAGQGANSGISDVHNLAWKLALVLKRHVQSSLLDTYEVERLPVDTFAAEVSGSAADERGLISMNKDLKTILSLARRLHITSGFGHTYNSKAIVDESTWPLGGLTWRAWTMQSVFLGLDGRPGSGAPHEWVQREGRRISTLDLLGRDFVLLAGSEGEVWCETAKHISSVLDGFKIVTYSLGPNGNISDPDRKWETAAGISSTGMLLVRPDGFVAWRERKLPANVGKRMEEVIRSIASYPAASTRM